MWIACIANRTLSGCIPPRHIEGLGRCPGLSCIAPSGRTSTALRSTCPHRADILACMLKVLGSSRRLCDRVSRREVLCGRRPEPVFFGAGRSAARGGDCRQRRGRPPAVVRPGETGDPALSLRRGGPARDVRSQARRACGDPRQVRQHRDGRAGSAVLRAPAAAGGASPTG